MPRPNRGPRLHWIADRQAFYILWYERCAFRAVPHLFLLMRMARWSAQPAATASCWPNAHMSLARILATAFAPAFVSRCASETQEAMIPHGSQNWHKFQNDLTDMTGEEAMQADLDCRP
jgi:hypothetical protein